MTSLCSLSQTKQASALTSLSPLPSSALRPLPSTCLLWSSISCNPGYSSRLLFNQGWPWTPNPPVPTSWMLGTRFAEDLFTRPARANWVPCQLLDVGQGLIRTDFQPPWLRTQLSRFMEYRITQEFCKDSFTKKVCCFEIWNSCWIWTFNWKKWCHFRSLGFQFIFLPWHSCVLSVVHRAHFNGANTTCVVYSQPFTCAY